jgi:CheY-like chemotaxis protein
MSDDQSQNIDTGAITQRLRALSAYTPLSLLLVDDDEIERSLIADRLSHRGFHVVEAENGAAALALMQKDLPPVVLVDWFMPTMDGIAFTEQVRAAGMHDVYIIMLTARASALDYQRGYQSGVDDYLTKKAPDIELSARLHTAFAMHALHIELRATQYELSALRAKLQAE